MYLESNTFHLESIVLASPSFFSNSTTHAIENTNNPIRLINPLSVMHWLVAQQNNDKKGNTLVQFVTIIC